MTAPVFTEALHPFDGLLESIHQLSIDEIIVAQNQTILVGQVLGATGVTANMTLAGAASANNVGTSTIGSISGNASAQNGVYTIELQATSSTGEIEVQKPDGTLDGVGKIGTAYVGSINFTITAAGTPTIGDLFTVTVTRPFDEAGEQFEAWGPANTDGSQAPIAIALQSAATGAGQTAKIAALRRDGAFRSSAATFGASSFTASQSTTTLTVSAMASNSGPIVLGATVTSGGTSQTITGFGTGTGGIGTYTVSVSQTLASQSMTATATTAQIAFATQQLASQRIVLR